jgi:hypothetical protein
LNFKQAILDELIMMRDYSQKVQTERWQGVKTDASMATYELRHRLIRCDMPTEDLQHYRDAIEPNIPWADDHFAERVCGQPINPGLQWKKWPYAHSAERFLNERKQFNHNYMERYWPKHAGSLRAAKFPAEYDAACISHEGIWEPYGDLRDVVKQIAREPLTRQAILPVFFPEDTGAVHGGRVPCSIFYQFLVRDGRMDVTYALRSCDIVRHFRDDIYLTVRLLLWVLQEARKLNPDLNAVRPGEFVMLITSLHMFCNDYYSKWGKHPRG